MSECRSEAVTFYDDEPKDGREPSATDRAVADLEKSLAELGHTIGLLAGRLEPVSVTTTKPDAGAATAAESMSSRAPLVRSIRESVEKAQRLTHRVVDITEGLDI